MCVMGEGGRDAFVYTSTRISPYTYMCFESKQTDKGPESGPAQVEKIKVAKAMVG